MPQIRTPKLSLSRKSLDEEKEYGSQDSLLPMSNSEKSMEARNLIKSPATSWRWTVLNIVLFIFSLSVLLHRLYEIHAQASDKNYLLKQTSYFSPILDKTDISTFVGQTDGSLFEPENPSPYRNARKPDPKVDAAWEEFDTIRTFPITEEEVRKLGKDPELAVKFPEEYGLGPDAYVAQLDILHQIHCLNLLRHLAWAEYDRDEKHGKKPFSDLHWVHVSHCTDMLMQNIMHFFVNHQCRDFDAIVRWQEENALPLMMGRNITRPPGAEEIPAPDGIYELLENDAEVAIHMHGKV